MRKLIVEEWVSLDGYVADKNGGLDFFTHLTSEQNTVSYAFQVKFMETVDTILLGRKTYELFVDFWPRATTDQEAMVDISALMKHSPYHNMVRINAVIKNGVGIDHKTSQTRF